MPHVLIRLADGLLTRFVPRQSAQAAACQATEQYCYCRNGYRYARQCVVCDGSTITCKECTNTNVRCPWPSAG